MTHADLIGPADATRRCRLLGHQYTFGAEESVLVWRCGRGCSAGGSRTYESPERARRMATALDRRDADHLGHRAPLIGLLPLRWWARWKRARVEGGAA